MNLNFGCLKLYKRKVTAKPINLAVAVSFVQLILIFKRTLPCLPSPINARVAVEKPHFRQGFASKVFSDLRLTEPLILDEACAGYCCPNLPRYSIEVIKALTISALTKLPLN